MPEILAAKTAESEAISVNPNVLVVLLHIGGVIRMLRDIEKGVEHVFKGQASAEDAKAILNDLGQLLSDGVFKIPGMTPEQVAAVVADLQKVV